MKTLLAHDDRIACTSAGSTYAVEYCARQNALWSFMQPEGNPCFSVDFLNTIRDFDGQFQRNRGHVEIEGCRRQVHYYTVASRTPGVFNLGGDLALFLRLIEAGGGEGLLEYARLCIDGVYARINNYFCTSLTTISLVQGEALGGGFEAALASDVVIAERSARMGLPEVLFNLFPGMGAYNLIARRIGRKGAEEVITSGEIFTAEQLHALGLVDVVAETGAGEQAVRDWIDRNQKRRNALQAVADVARVVHPVTRQQLDDIAELWAAAAMRLDEKDLRLMQRIVQSQLRRCARAMPALQ